MDEGKQVQVQQYNWGARMLPKLEQSQKVVVQLDPGKNVWTPAQIVNAQLERAGHIVSRLYTEESIPGTGNS